MAIVTENFPSIYAELDLIMAAIETHGCKFFASPDTLINEGQVAAMMLGNALGWLREEQYSDS